MKRLDENFYSQSAVVLAPKLLGKIICREIDGEVFKVRITETECYYGEEDTACHASRGVTSRTSVMYSKGGVAYVYLCYGIHHLLNIVTGAEGHPEAVLIRSVEGAGGPGLTAKLLKIDKTLNGENLVKSDRLWLADDGDTTEFTTSKRIGIDYASKEDREKLWRYTIK